MAQVVSTWGLDSITIPTASGPPPLNSEAIAPPGSENLGHPIGGSRPRLLNLAGRASFFRRGSGLDGGVLFVARFTFFQSAICRNLAQHFSRRRHLSGPGWSLSNAVVLISAPVHLRRRQRCVQSPCLAWSGWQAVGWCRRRTIRGQRRKRRENADPDLLPSSGTTDGPNGPSHDRPRPVPASRTSSRWTRARRTW